MQAAATHPPKGPSTPGSGTMLKTNCHCAGKEAEAAHLASGHICSFVNILWHPTDTCIAKFAQT